MAAAAKTADDDTEIPAPPVAPAKKSGGGIGMLLAAVVLSVAASGGVSWFVSQQTIAALTPKAEGEETEEEEEEVQLPKSPANYIALEPAFIVNLEGEHSQRFLQVQVEVMTRDPKLGEQVQRHAPRIRSALLLLFGQQRVEDIATRAGKERLQTEVLAEIQKILRAETGKADLEAVYFTSFVMQ